jgi:hypothetical protein
MSAFGGQRVTGKLQLRLRHSDLLKNLPLNWTGKNRWGKHRGKHSRHCRRPRMCAKKRTCVRQLIFFSLDQAQLCEWGIRTGGPHGSLPVHEDDRSPKFCNTITYGDDCGPSLAELRPRTNCRRTDRSLKALAGLTGLAHPPATLNLHDTALQLALQAFGAPKCIGSVFF